MKRKICTALFLILTAAFSADAKASEELLSENLDISPILLAEDTADFQAKAEEKESKPGFLRSSIEFYENTRKIHDGLSEKGITIELNHTNDTFMNFSGTLSKRTAVKSMSLLDMSLALDSEKLGLWKGGTAFVQGHVIYGKGLSNGKLGDLQVVSNIEADDRTQLSEYWYEQRLFNDKLRIAGGKQDANGEFGIVETAGDYIGSSFALLPNVPMPSYPDQALGVWGEIAPTEWAAIKAGFYDGDSRGNELGFRTAFRGSNGYITLVQGELKPKVKEHKGDYILGYWTHSNNAETIGTDDVERMTSNYGLYTEFEQQVFKENKKDDQGLSILGQFSWAPSNRNEIARYYGAGCSYKGLLPKRNDDVLGVGLALADLSPAYKRYNDLRNEGVIEIFYKFVLNDLVTLQPDLQVIFNTGGTDTTSFALGLRSIISIAPRSPEKI